MTNKQETMKSTIVHQYSSSMCSSSGTQVKSSQVQKFRHTASRRKAMSCCRSVKSVKLSEQTVLPELKTQTPASCRRQTLVMGLSKELVLVLICSRRTNPLLSGKVWITLPMTHEFRGAVSSTISTTSPSTKLRLILVHF